MSKQQKKRTPAQRENDLNQIAYHYLRGKTQLEISRIIGTSRTQVTYDLQTLYKRWRQESLQNIDELKTRELQKIDRTESTFWDAWERSCTVREKRVVCSEWQTDAKTGEQKMVPTEGSVTNEGRDGDPRFLEGVLRCIERRCRILGIDAPAKMEHTGADGEPIEVKMTHEQRLARVRDLVERAKSR